MQVEKLEILLEVKLLVSFVTFLSSNKKYYPHFNKIFRIFFHVKIYITSLTLSFFGVDNNFGVVLCKISIMKKQIRLQVSDRDLSEKKTDVESNCFRNLSSKLKLKKKDLNGSGCFRSKFT